MRGAGEEKFSMSEETFQTKLPNLDSISAPIVAGENCDGKSLVVIQTSLSGFMF